jgi:YHS domain-containing protein
MVNTISMKKIGAAILLLFAGCTSLLAQDALSKKHYNLEAGLALQGYDPVAYFTQAKSMKGQQQYAVFYNGVTYYFASPEHKTLFKNNPARYEPQYGGWCAYAMGAKGQKVTIDPETFKIRNGKLYLFYNKLFNNTLKDWNKDEPALCAKADTNWTNIYH